MADIIYREYRQEDIPELSVLWHSSFGDSIELISHFFRLLPELGTAVVAEQKGVIVGAAYVMGELRVVGLPHKSPVGGYIYAVSVDESHRHRGIGSALVKFAGEKAREIGADFVCTLPAEEQLYAWYNDILGTQTALYMDLFTVNAEALYPCRRLTTEEYMQRREELLSGRVHLRPPKAALEFTRLLCEACGGGLYLCNGGLCAAYVDDGVCFVTELICESRDVSRSVAASVGAALGTEMCKYRLPSEKGSPYLAAEPGFIPRDCVWNLTFD